MDNTKVQELLHNKTCSICEVGSWSFMDSVGNEEKFLWCSHCESTVDESGVIERGCGTQEYIWSPDVCTSSLDEWGWPITYGETEHKWNDEIEERTGKDIIKCSECGAIKE